MGFSDREGYTAEAEAQRRQELGEHGACPLCEGKGVVDEGNMVCPDCDGSGYAVRPPGPYSEFDADGRAT